MTNWEETPLFPELEKAEEKIGPSSRDSDPWTSLRAALIAFDGPRRTQRMRVFDALVEVGRYGRGLTADEIVLQHGLRHDVTSRRLTDLKQMGLIYASEGRRLTSGGRMAIVWCVEPVWLDKALDARVRSPHA